MQHLRSIGIDTGDLGPGELRHDSPSLLRNVLDFGIPLAC